MFKTGSAQNHSPFQAVPASDQISLIASINDDIKNIRTNLQYARTLYSQCGGEMDVAKINLVEAEFLIEILLRQDEIQYYDLDIDRIQEETKNNLEIALIYFKT